jgi:hypothetical protein
MYYASNLFFVLTLGLSKLSVGFFLLRLTTVRLHKVIFMAVMAFITAWTIAAIFAVALQCNLSQPWIIIGERCPHSVRLPLPGRVDHKSLLNQVAPLVSASTSPRHIRYSHGTMPVRYGCVSCMGPQNFNEEQGPCHERIRLPPHLCLLFFISISAVYHDVLE